MYVLQHCWHLRLKDLCAVFASHLFFGVSWNCQGTFAGLLESSAWLQRAAGHIWGGFRASVSLDTTPEPFAFPLQQLWAVPLLSHLCFSLCCGFLPKCFLGCAFWVLCSPLFLLFFSACRVLLHGSCHRDHSTSLCLCERHCCPCVAWLAEPTASSQMCHLSLPHTVWPDCPVGWQAAYLCPGMRGYAIVLHSRLPVSIPDPCTVVEDNELLSSPMARLPLPSSMPSNFNPPSAFHLLGTVVLLVCKDQSSRSASASECQGTIALLAWADMQERGRWTEKG